MAISKGGSKVNNSNNKGNGVNFDVVSNWSDFVSTLDTEFAKENVYTDIMDWYDNGGVDLEAFGITLTDQQRLILAVCYGLELTEQQLSILESWASDEVTREQKGRTTYDFDLGPAVRQFIVLECGRRGSKTMLGSLMVCYEFENLCRMPCPQRELNIASSSPISFVVLASSADQAEETIFAYTRGMVNNVPYLKKLLEMNKIESLETEIRYPEKSLKIKSGNSKAESQVGGNVFMLVLDEAAMFNNKSGENNALKLWDDLGAGGAPFGSKHKRLAISSAGYPGDAMEQLYADSKEAQEWVGFRLKSWQVNPIHAARDNPVVNAVYIRDIRKAQLLFEGVRTATINCFFEPDSVKASFTLMSNLYAKELPITDDKLLRVDVLQLNPYYGRTIMHIDPATTRDNYGLAYGHSEQLDGELHVYIDGIMAWMPREGARVSYISVYNAIMSIHMKRPISKLTTDHDAAVETLQRCNSIGIKTDIIRATNHLQMASYDATKRLMDERRLHLPKNSPWTKLLKEELLNVELIKNTKIDHRAGMCFVGDTKIALLDGTNPNISELVGKEVWVYSSTLDGMRVTGRARGRFSRNVTELVDVTLMNGAIVRCTPEHPFMITSGEYVEAKYLSPGKHDLMSTFDTRYSSQKVIKLESVILTKAVPVYDLEVDKWHNFALSAGVFVHNSKDIADAVTMVTWQLLGLSEFDGGIPIIIPTNKNRRQEELLNNPYNFSTEPKLDSKSYMQEVRSRKSRWSGIGNTNDTDYS